MMLDGAALRWFHGLYGFDEQTLRIAAAGLLWAMVLPISWRSFGSASRAKSTSRFPETDERQQVSPSSFLSPHRIDACLHIVSASRLGRTDFSALLLAITGPLSKTNVSNSCFNRIRVYPYRKIDSRALDLNEL